MRCPVCQHDNADGAKFCSECGTRLELRCSVCSTAYEPGAKFCSECGNNLQQAGSERGPSAEDDDLSRYLPEELLRKIRAARSGQSMRGERRTVTMLFADIEGSTAAAEHLDPEEWADIVNGAFRHLIEPVYRYEGTLARLQGDAILAFFGAPIAHEDDPVRAVRAALDILAEVRPYTDEVETRHGVHIGVRVGINTGLVVVGEVGSDLRVEYTALGDAINIAARMEQTAEPGTVRVTGETLALLGNVFVSEEVGPVDVKGKAEPVMAHQVIGLAGRGDDAQGTSTPLLGRDAELQALLDALGRLDDGLGAVCTVIGEAGIGKSRLLSALRDGVASKARIASTWSQDADLSWVRGRARSYERNVPYATFTDLLREWWDRDRDDECFEVVMDALEPALGRRDADMAGLLAHIVGAPLPDDQARLIGSLTAPVLHDRTTSAVVEYAGAEARRRPLVIVLDDLHWADALTLTLVEQLMELCEFVPLALVLVMRPNREDPAWRLVESAGRDHAHLHTAIELEALPDAATEDLLARLLGGADVPAALRRDVLERANGNPLFVEEIARTLGESGNDRTGLAGPVPVEVPASLAGLLTARLDRLEEEARTIAQVASVIGREFDLDTLASVVEGVDDDAMRELLRRGILEERSRVPVPMFSFRHPLIREAAYSTVLLRTRRELHARIARHLQQSDSAAVEEIAHHYVEAGEPTAAFPFLIEAGQRAVRVMALSDAIAHFTTALEAPADDATSEQILAAHSGLGEAYALVPDLSRSSAAFQSLVDYGRSMGKPDIEVTALNRLGFNTAALSGDAEQAMVYLRQAKALAESVGDEFGLAEYHMNACFISTMTGNIDEAVAHDAETARLGELVGNQHMRLLGLVRKSANLVSLLRFDEAQEVIAEGLEVAETEGDDSLLAVLQCNCLGTMEMIRGDLERAWERYTRHLPTLDRYASEYSGFSHRGMAELCLLRGDLETALSEFGAAERVGRAEQQLFALAAGLAGRVRVMAMCGMFDGIETLGREAASLLDQPTGEFLGSSVLADLGTARLLSADLDGARDHFARALATSSVTAKWERPRILFGLTCVALDAGQQALAAEHLDEARTHVATHGLNVYTPELLLLDGMLAAATDRYDDAGVSLGEAIRSASESGRRLVEVEAIRHLAGVRAHLGESGEAERLRERARATVDEVAKSIIDDDLRAGFAARTLGEAAAGETRKPLEGA